MPLFVSEKFVNATEGWRFGESGVYESGCETPGEVYRAMQREYGGCTGKVYVDLPEGPPKQIGWVFQRREKYEDSPEKTYLREVWVTLHDAPDTVTRTSHHHYL